MNFVHDIIIQHQRVPLCAIFFRCPENRMDTGLSVAKMVKKIDFFCRKKWGSPRPAFSPPSGSTYAPNGWLLFSLFARFTAQLRRRAAWFLAFSCFGLRELFAFSICSTPPLRRAWWLPLPALLAQLFGGLSPACPLSCLLPCLSSFVLSGDPLPAFPFLLLPIPICFYAFRLPDLKAAAPDPLAVFVLRASSFYTSMLSRSCVLVALPRVSSSCQGLELRRDFVCSVSLAAAPASLPSICLRFARPCSGAPVYGLPSI